MWAKPRAKRATIGPLGEVASGRWGRGKWRQVTVPNYLVMTKLAEVSGTTDV